MKEQQIITRTALYGKRNYHKPENENHRHDNVFAAPLRAFDAHATHTLPTIRLKANSVQHRRTNINRIVILIPKRVNTLLRFTS